MESINLAVDPIYLEFIVGAVLPPVVDLITKKFASGRLKSIILLLLSAISGVLTSIIAAGGQFELQSALFSVFIIFVTSVASLFGVYKPTNISGANGAIQNALPGGLGSDRTKDTITVVNPEEVLSEAVATGEPIEEVVADKVSDSELVEETEVDMVTDENYVYDPKKAQDGEKVVEV